MRVTIKFLATCLLILIVSCSYAQMQEYNYKREINGITDQWNKLILPDEIFGKTSNNLSDIRIFGITTSKDTIEAPYILKLRTEKVLNNKVGFKTINTSHNKNGFYYTFEIPTKETINQIKLNFNQQNFDWKLSIEGSQNQQEWFTVIKDYRILSIKNELTDFEFAKVIFPSAKYRYYRLSIDSKKNPDLLTATISKHKLIDGDYRLYPIEKTKITENKKEKQTNIEVDLILPVTVSHFKINIKDSFDYYRPFTIKYLSDSTETEKGWIYNYRILMAGTLNSIEENEFKLNSTTLQKLKIEIYNGDNHHLTIDSIQVKGYVHELISRFTEPATYYLTYGNSDAKKPNYDINRFSDKIPKKLTTLKLGVEQIIKKNNIASTEPLFKNKIWLWTIMVTIILLLGGFTLKMIKK